MGACTKPKARSGTRVIVRKDIVPVGLRNVDTESKWSKSGYRGWVQGYRLVVQGLAFPEPVPIFAAWRPNNENEANIAIEALLAGELKVTDVLLGDETFGGGLFPYLYEEAGGWVLSPKQLPQERRSWKDDLYDYRKEAIEAALSTDHSSIGLERMSGQRRRSKWRIRLGQCLALPDLLSHELPRGQAAGVYQRSSGLRSMAHPNWLITISFNLHRLHITYEAWSILEDGTVLYEATMDVTYWTLAKTGGRTPPFSRLFCVFCQAL